MEQGETNTRIKDWVKEVLNPILLEDSNIPNEEVVGQLGGIALLSADTDKIKDYVFESARLPEIRGASMILDYLNQGWPLDSQTPSNIREIFLYYGLPTRRNKNDTREDCIIYAGGGSLLAIVPIEFAKILKSDIERIYSQSTKAATITCVWNPVSAKDLCENFNRVMKLQRLRLRRAKEEKELLPFFEAIPYARRCESCGIRPAISWLEERWLCDPCKKKIDRSKKEKGKKQWIEEFVDELQSGSLDCNSETYWDGYKTAKPGFAIDLNEIAFASVVILQSAVIYISYSYMLRGV